MGVRCGGKVEKECSEAEGGDKWDVEDELRVRLVYYFLMLDHP